MKGIKYIINEKGDKKAILLDLDLYGPAVEELLEDIYGHKIILSRKKDKKLSKKEFLKGLKDAQLI